MSQQVRYALGRFRSRDPEGGAAEFSAVVVGERAVDLADLVPAEPTLTGLLLDWARLGPALDAAVLDATSGGLLQGRSVPLQSLRPLAPYTPPQIFQSGANYHTHVVQLMVAAAAEAGETDLEAARERASVLMSERAAHGTPYVFIGLPSAVCGPWDDVVLPDTGTHHDWELELGVVIGTEADHVGPADALGHVAGYVVVNDITTRDRVFRPDIPGLGTDWLAGKNAPTFLPLGPWVVPARFVPDPMDLRVTLQLNGTTMQDESTADMIFDVARLIAHVSAITPLRPGDLLLTGSPAGNGAHYGRYLRPGDVMTSTISGLGRQRNACVARGARSSATPAARP